jgi:hypothetical protein
MFLRLLLNVLVKVELITGKTTKTRFWQEPSVAVPYIFIMQQFILPFLCQAQTRTTLNLPAVMCKRKMETKRQKQNYK